MRVVLREDVDTLGKKGDLLEVADGYARNYLVPRGLAMKATKGVVAQSESMRRSREAKEVRDREAAQAIAAQLGSRAVEVKARAGEGGKLFGSVTASDVADARPGLHRPRARPAQGGPRRADPRAGRRRGHRAPAPRRRRGGRGEGRRRVVGPPGAGPASEQALAHQVVGGEPARDRGAGSSTAS